MKNTWFRRTDPLFSVCCLVLTAYCLVLHSSPLYAEVPHLIRYQGQAVDSKGVPLEGPYTLTFRLYDVETGGTELWKEKQDAIQLTGGHFSVLLGQVTSLTPMNWDKPCWLSVQVNGEPELSPRQRITSVPLALRAERAEMATQAEQLTVPVTTSTITDNAHALVPSGAIILWDGASCPAGYTRLAAYDDRFLVAGSAAGVPGGSNTHSHGAGGYTVPNHTHAFEYAPTSKVWNLGNQYVVAQEGHVGAPPNTLGAYGLGGSSNANVMKNTGTAPGGAASVSGTSSTADSRPAFMTILLCKKD